jgi:hypothetical protein
VRRNLRLVRAVLQLVGAFIPHRYEEEINKRTSSENDFVVLKKVREVLRGTLCVCVCVCDPYDTLRHGQGDLWVCVLPKHTEGEV